MCSLKRLATDDTFNDFRQIGRVQNGLIGTGSVLIQKLVLQLLGRYQFAWSDNTND